MLQKTVGVYIGRFQPFHEEHYRTITHALGVVDTLVILVGSSYIPRSFKNPFTYEERVSMISNTIAQEMGTLTLNRVKYEPLVDNLYDDNDWAIQVRTLVSKHTESPNAVVKLFGSVKDDSSFYFDLFPSYEKHLTPISRPIDATFIRELYFCEVPKLSYLTQVVPKVVLNFLNKFSETQDFKNLVNEVNFIKDYKKQWAVAPYPVTFVTTDAVVVQSGHVLLITRKAYPGKGLYALPGGFLDANKDASLLDCCLRELKEETKIELPMRVLRGSIKSTRAFDAINRSERGRTITHAFHLQLEDNRKLPKVKASDDAASCQWVDIATLDPRLMYEDHYSIIKYFV